MKGIKSFKKFLESYGNKHPKWDEIRTISSEKGVQLNEEPTYENFSKEGKIWGTFMKFILFGDLNYQVNLMYPDENSTDSKELVDFYYEFFKKLEKTNFLDSFRNLDVKAFEQVVEDIHKTFGKEKLKKIVIGLLGPFHSQSLNMSWIERGDNYGERKLTNFDKKFLESKRFHIKQED